MTHDERRALWQHRLADQQASGLSIVAWCWQQDIREQTFYYWRKRLANATPPPSAPQWVALETTSSRESELTLQVGSVAITVTPGFDPHLLTDVVRVLTARC